jgi:hypothetical protein
MMAMSGAILPDVALLPGWLNEIAGAATAGVPA